MMCVAAVRVSGSSSRWLRKWSRCKRGAVAAAMVMREEEELAVAMNLKVCADLARGRWRHCCSCDGCARCCCVVVFAAVAESAALLQAR